ncbi:MAG: CopG family transcriptional regulator [Planctomycetota bacterium]|jgi:hypothetical protein
MKRTTVMLPAGLRARAIAHARQLGISMGELIRRSMESMLAGSQEAGGDPLVADEAVFDGPLPDDLASNHDRYLYGDKEP